MSRHGDAHLTDRGTHIEVPIGAAALAGSACAQIVAEALARFGAKPLLVVSDGPASLVGIGQAYQNGLKLSAILCPRIAIVLGGREPTDADRMIELVARNRGRDVRAFRDLREAKAWLGVD